MNFDKYINMFLIQLSYDYDINLIEIKKPKKTDNNRVFLSKTYTLNYKDKGTSSICNEKITFYNKRDLLEYLKWLSQ